MAKICFLAHAEDRGSQEICTREATVPFGDVD